MFGLIQAGAHRLLFNVNHRERSARNSYSMYVAEYTLPRQASLRQYPFVLYNLLLMNEQTQNPEQPTSSAPAPVNPPRTGIKKHIHSVWEIIEFAVIALVIVIPIRAFVAQPFVVSGTSMVPTFENGDYLIVDELSYRFESPHRGDVVVFKYPKDESLYFIKRIIGVPGDTVQINGSTVTIVNAEHPEGFKLDEPYIANKSSNITTTVVTPGNYFVMGDNRPASSDSRFWGLVPAKLLTGRAFLQLLPVSHLGVFPGEHTFAN
jgi:signal peptidase I